MAASDIQRWLTAIASTEHNLDNLGHQYHGYKYALMTFISDRSKKTLTIYESLNSRPDISHFMKLVDACSPIKELLQRPDFCSTVWAPQNSSTEPWETKLWDNISKEDLHEFLHRHISPEFLPIYFLLTAPTIDTSLWSPELNGMQRVTLHPSIIGMRINNCSTILESDCLLKNGLVHIIDQPIPPAPSIQELIMALPSQDFGLFQRAFQFADYLLENIGHSQLHGGITVFIPTNSAFHKLSEATQSLIFSDHGNPYLKTLIRYHVVTSQTIYSNRLYTADTPSEQYTRKPSSTPSHTVPTAETQDDPLWRVLKGRRQFVLPTSLEGQNLSVGITRFGGLISMRVNGIANVTVQDGLASNGVCHVVDSVLCPMLQNQQQQNHENDTRLDMSEILKILTTASNSIY